jgi:hypothetical protein
MTPQTNSDVAVHPTQIIKPGVVNVLAELRQTRKPIVATVNQTDFVVDDEGSYQSLIALIARLESIAGTREALEDVDAGRTLTLDEFKTEVRRRHGPPD